ncbi:MAG: PAS domain S-box protein [Rhodocyclaceae bacterium]|nr:PAS domain S-box protein [Rhodocyclaceae bacterium]
MIRSTIRYKAHLALAVLVVLALVNMALGERLLSKVDAVSETVVATSDLYRLTKRILGTRAHPRAMDPSVREHLFAPLDDAVASRVVSERPLEGLTDNHTQLEVLWGDLARDWHRLRVGYDAFRRSPPDRWHASGSALDGLASELEASIGAVHFLAARELEALHERLSFAIVGVGLLDISVIGLLLVGLRSKVLLPLSHLASGARALSPESYDHRFASAEPNEIGDLARALDRSLGQVKDLLHDVRSNAEQKAQAEERFRALVEHAGVGVFLLRGDRLSYANRHFSEVVGQPVVALVGRRSIEDLVNVEERAGVGAALASCLDGDVRTLRLECSIVRPGGEFRACELYAARTVLGGEPSVIGSLVDHTERKVAEQDLRKLQRAIEQSRATVLVTDRDGMIEYVNPHFTELTGFEPQEAIGRKPSIVSSGLTPPEVFRDLWAAITAGRVWSGELLNRKKNGELFWEHMIASAVRDSDGAISHFVAVKEDITERKRSERELERLNRTLRVLSGANQTLVHAKDEAGLLEATCASLVDEGGYFLASVRVPLGEGGALVPLASHGAGPDSESVVARMPEVSRVREQAYRERRPILEAHLSGRFDIDGRSEAVRSMISLPLIGNDATLGVLSLFSTEAEAFSSDDQALLRELADDLAYGLSYLRTREERARAESALRESEERFRSISSSARDAIVMFEADGRVSYWNEAATRISGFSSAEMVGRNRLDELIAGRDLPAVAAVLRDLSSGGKGRFIGKTLAFDILRADGKPISVEASTSATRLAGRWQLVVVARDISARRAAEAAINIRNRAIESSSNAIIISRVEAARDNPIVYVNPAFERISGFTLAEVEGRNPRFLIGKDWDQVGIERLRDALRRHIAAQVLLRNYRKDGSLFWAEVSVSPVLDDGGELTHYISVITDVTERIRFEEELKHHATHDGLTGLANRVLLSDRIDQAVAHAQRSGRQAAVLMLDLDRFKFINDSLGHSAGDAVVKAVGERLEACLRRGDTVARIGGDEFALVLAELSAGLGVSNVIGKIEDALAAPVELPGQQLFVTASVGVSLAPADGTSAEALLRNADAAMYAAKEHGGACFRYYQQGMNDRALQQLSLEADLRGAIERGELVLHYQPKLDLRTGRICGAEALIRWQHPAKGMISPLDFIPLAEETGLIVPIGEWALGQACRDAARWRERHGAPIAVAVNISARQFRQGDLPARVEEALREAELPSWCLELELTESMIMQNAKATTAALEALKAIGIKLSIDDFGTGYSSLSYLRHFPVDVLKIDRSFVKDLSDSEDCRTIAGTIMVLAHGLGMSVVAEGVETEDQLRFLGLRDCDMIQGYLFSRPLPVSDFERLLEHGAGERSALVIDLESARQQRR